MTHTLSFVSLVVAIVCFAVAGSLQPSPPSPWNSRLVCYGLAFFAAAFALNQIP